jgi:mono/diheme cytochrome c family protein
MHKYKRLQTYSFSLTTIAAGLLLASCGDSGADTSGGQGGAGGTGATSSTTTSTTTTTSSGSSLAPTFYKDVAPIVYNNCVSCHKAGGIAPFPLVDYKDALPTAGLMKSETASRNMPPFHINNHGDCNTYRDAQWLSDEEIATIAAWVDGGSLEGNPADAPPLPAEPPGLDKVSKTLDMGVKYTPDASLSDDYRCFLVDPGLAEDHYLTAYHVKPGEPKVVHHVVVFAPITEADQQKAEELDAAEAGPGYTCFGGASVPAQIMVGWAPGVPATRYPEGTGLRVAAGRKLVLQVHYNLSTGALPDQTKVDLELEKTVAKPASIHTVLDVNLSLTPGMEEVHAGATKNGPNTDVMVHGVFPHMHTLGRKLSVNVMGGACLADVPDYDFNWQQFYMYKDPIAVPAGSKLSIACQYNTLGQVKTVTWGEGTGDEMCVALLYITK